MLIALGRTVLICLLICASAAAAQERSFADIVDWVRRDGKSNLVWDVAKILKVETSATKAVQKLVLRNELKRFYGLQVYADNTDVIMLRRSPERTAVWRMTPDGKIVQTLTFMGVLADAKIVPNEQHMDWWKETVDALSGSISAEQTAANSLTMFCEYRESADDPPVPSPSATYFIDLVNDTVSIDYPAAPRIRYTAAARITKGKIEWKWQTSNYSLDRATGELSILNGTLKFTWHCKTKTASTTIR